MDGRMNPGVDSHTPHLAVIDSRGLAVRQVACCRRDVSEPTSETRVTAQQHDAAGWLVTQRDPRFLAPTERPNLTTVYSLSGAVLLTDSVDAGWRASLLGEADQPVQGWDGRGSQRWTDYDNQLRPLALFEQAVDGEPLCIERLEYGSAEPAFADHNQCGQLVRHDDPAGTQLFAEFGLTAGAGGGSRHVA
jgi:insecticidal toxin complex protein TccC